MTDDIRDQPGEWYVTTGKAAPGPAMSISPQVRETGRMLDIHGFTVTFGVDHECVTIDARSITIPATDPEFTRHLLRAIEAAQAQAGTPCTGACCPPTEEG